MSSCWLQQEAEGEEGRGGEEERDGGGNTLCIQYKTQ